MIYEWDGEKARASRQKHGVSFEEATTVFLDPLALTFPDPEHSDEEKREITIGHSTQQRTVFVSHCARKATKGERKQYEQGIGGETG